VLIVRLFLSPFLFVVFDKTLCPEFTVTLFLQLLVHLEDLVENSKLTAVFIVGDSHVLDEMLQIKSGSKVTRKHSVGIEVDLLGTCGTLADAAEYLLRVKSFIADICDRFAKTRHTTRNRDLVDHLGMLTAASLANGELVRNVVLFAVLIYELVGPALTKHSLLSVGEIKPEGRTSARMLNATK